MKKGLIFENSNRQFIILDFKCNNTLLMNVNNGEYVVAWGLKVSDVTNSKRVGSWTSGSYFIDLQSAVNKLGN